MIWQWTGKSLVAMRAVQQGLLVGWICHTFDVKMGFFPKNWTSQVKHCTMTSNFWFWETVPAWYVKICLKNTSHHLFLYFLNFWVHFTYVHYDQPKMVDLPNIPHAINSWQFLQGKKTAYWMYFGLYIRWKFRKHYGKHSGHGSVHLWHHSGISLFLFLLWSSETRKPVNKLLFDHSWELEFSHQKRGACHWYLWQILLPLFHQKLFADLARCSRCLLPPLAVYQWSIVSYQQGFLEYCASLTHTNIKINKQKTLKTLLCQGWGSVKLTRLENFCSDWNGGWSSAMQLSQSENIPLHLCDLLLQNFFFRVWFISLILTLNIAIM